jgi:putative ABC transport system permease protein
VKTWINITIALRALRSNPLRSILTMLGIIIGVAAVITMVSIGAGAQMQIAERIRSLGANLLVIIPGSQASEGVRYAAGTQHTLTEGDSVAIVREIPVVRVAAPAIYGTAQVINGNRNWNTTVVGGVPDHLVARDWRVETGGSFSLADVSSATKVALLGSTVAKKLFDENTPIGQRIRISEVPFTVVGLLGSKGSDGAGRDQDDIIIIPLSTAKMRVLGGSHEVNRKAVDYISVKVRNAEDMDVAEQQISRLLRQRHNLEAETPDDFNIINMTEVLKTRQATLRTLGFLLAAVASVSLVVGGISIMNIMLVSVTERTREIGLRLAVGARRRDLRGQFLVEAVILSLLGGVIGILLGCIAAFAIASSAGWAVLITPGAIVLAVGFSAGVGIFFGFYPAHKASKLDPIEALRLE